VRKESHVSSEKLPVCRFGSNHVLDTMSNDLLMTTQRLCHRMMDPRHTIRDVRFSTRRLRRFTVICDKTPFSLADRCQSFARMFCLRFAWFTLPAKVSSLLSTYTASHPAVRASDSRLLGPCSCHKGEITFN
jgi:hypothetical protein